MSDRLAHQEASRGSATRGGVGGCPLLGVGGPYDLASSLKFLESF